MVALKDFRQIRIRTVPCVQLIYSLVFLVCGCSILLTSYYQNIEDYPEHEASSCVERYKVHSGTFWAMCGVMVSTFLGALLSIWMLWTSETELFLKYQLWLKLTIFLLVIKLICFSVAYQTPSKHDFDWFFKIFLTLFSFSLTLDLFGISILLILLKSGEFPPLECALRRRDDVNDTKEFIPKGKLEQLRLLRTSDESGVSSYYNDTGTYPDDAVNFELGKIDGMYHHHFGIGPSHMDLSKGSIDETALRNELHRLETAQVQYLMDYLGPIGKDDRVLDAGCGRGGTSIMIHDKSGCWVDGVSISDDQVDFANKAARTCGIDTKVKYHFQNMLSMEFGNESFTHVWNNESTMFVPLDPLFTELNRVMKKGGRYVCVTAVWVGSAKPQSVKTIDEQYGGCNTHERSEYLTAMLSHGLCPVAVVDLTQEAIPYFELREHSSLATGVEKYFLQGYRNKEMFYILIACDKY